MSDSGDLFKHTSASTGNSLVAHKKNGSAETASRERRRPWPVNRKVPTAVMVANEFVRHGLTSFLKGTQFQIVTTVAKLSEMDTVMDGEPTPALIIMAFDDVASADAVRTLRTTFADAKVVLLRRSNARESLPEDVRLTVQAVLDFDIAREALIAALAVVMSGRELEVLQALATGASNKAIAQRCNIAESTVKYYVKNILRKLRMLNRTQAAIWACKHRTYC